MKKTLILAVLLTFFTSIFAFDFEYENNTLAYTILTDSTVSVAASATKPTGALIIPDSVEYNELKYAVTEVAENGFKGQKSITSIMLPSTMKHIRKQAFRDLTQENLTITLNEGLEIIGNRAFCASSGLSGTIEIPASIDSISGYAFYNCTGIAVIKINRETPCKLQKEANYFTNVVKIEVPCQSGRFYRADSQWAKISFEDPCEVIVDNIRYVATSNTEAMALGYTPTKPTGRLEFPETIQYNANTLKVTEIYDKAFSYLGITELILPKYLTKIGKESFRDNNSLKKITLNENLKHIGDRAFCQCTAIEGNLIFPASVITIEDYSFYNCYNIDTLKILANNPPELKGIHAFKNDAAFLPPVIIIPCGLSEIYNAANNWGSLALLESCSATKTIDGVIYELIPSTLQAIAKTTTNDLPTDLTLQEMIVDGVRKYKVTEIGNSCFEGLSSLHSVVVSNTIEKISKNAFYECKNLQRVVLGDAVDTIADFAFYTCSLLDTITFNEGLLSIGNRAFCNCKELKHVTLPSTLTRIDEWAFGNTTNLESVIMRAQTPPSLDGKGGWFMFNAEQGKTATYDIYVLCGTIDYYQTASGWSGLGDRVKEICEPLVIHHHTSTTGVKSFEGGNPVGIEYRRTFTPFIWETIYLPFEIDEMYLIEDGMKYDMNLVCVPSIQNGYFYLAEFDKDEFVFSSDKQLKSGKPYAIMFDDTYYEDKEFVFATSELVHIPFSGKPSASASSMSYVGNTTMMPQPIRAPFYTSETLPEGYFDIRYESGILQPFECVLYPQKAAPAAQLPRRIGAPRKPNTATSIPGAPMIDSNALICFANGNTLSILTQGKSVTIYSVMGNLIATIPQGMNEASVELNTGCYIIVAEGYSQKIIL